jgi:hypothetical protein
MARLKRDSSAPFSAIPKIDHNCAKIGEFRSR